ncbi:hypothetical protein WG66_007894 [Moniliophthora roreri]|nr:hypothetical protein WG66_007894 [Moniliophthora roreri]
MVPNSRMSRHCSCIKTQHSLKQSGGRQAGVSYERAFNAYRDKDLKRGEETIVHAESLSSVMPKKTFSRQPQFQVNKSRRSMFGSEKTANALGQSRKI